MARELANDWVGFVSAIADVAGIDADRIRAETRLVEDLGLDSLALTEVVTLLLVDYEVESVPERFQDFGWEGVTAADVFREFAAVKRIPLQFRVDSRASQPKPDGR